MVADIFTLLVVFQLKHFLCDFPLQNKYMLGKFKDGTDWMVPLATHTSVHALFTAAIAAYWLYPLTHLEIETIVLLALLDFWIHFIMDRVKASKNILGRFKIDQPYFWWSLGLDQMVHHLTHYFIIFWLVTM